MAIKEIIEIVKAPEVREDAWWITYIESEPPEDDEHNGYVKVAVKGTDEFDARNILYREYEVKWGGAEYVEPEAKPE